MRFSSALRRYKVKSFVGRKNSCAAVEGSFASKSLEPPRLARVERKSCQANSWRADFSVSAMTF
jgi:hypothetical protein